jgi:Bacterial surface proteins containing Ig-like domains
MKPLFSSIIAALAVLSMVACGPKDDPVIAVTGISLSQTSVSLEVGGKVSLTATVSPSDATDKTVTWTSSNSSVASVSGGVVTAAAEGTATITASAGGKSAKCEVSVKRKVVDVTGVSLNKTDLTLNPGETFLLEATVSPSDATDKTVTWTSSDPSVVSVESGLVKAVSAGTATVTATAGGKSAKCEVNVQPRVVDVTGISLNKTDLTLNPGGTFQLEATVSPSDATDKTVTWTSSDPSVVSVENGLVKAVSPGYAIVTATAGGKSARCEVTVQIPSSNEGYGYEDLK